MFRFSMFSLAVLVCVTQLLVGCGGPAVPPVTPVTSHDHPEHGPHEGRLIELGEEEYHAELTHDDATKTVTIYLLGKDAKTAVAIPDAEITLNLVVDKEPMQVKLTATKQEGDAEGEASKFTIVDEKVLEALEAPKTVGTVVVTIAGKSYSGAVAHEAHGHEHSHK